MAICAHCGRIVKGIRDHIRDKHGYPYYKMTPVFTYEGSKLPPYLQDKDIVPLELKY